MDNDSDTSSASPSPVSSTRVSYSEPKLASAPFDGPRGDVILRTSDSVDFRVVKAILVLASPVFETMFTLPQPAANPDCPAPTPVIPLSESSPTIDLLLRLCYPIETPELSARDVSLVGDVLAAALKYEIDAAIGPARKALERCAERSSKNALAVYAIACHLKLEAEARAAALVCLRWSFPGPTVPQLALMSGLDYFNLLDYHKKASDAIVSLFTKNRYQFVTSTCAELIPRNHACQGSKKLSYTVNNEDVDVTEYSCWASSKLVFSEAFKSAPLATDKLSLWTLAPILEACQCHICKNKFFHGWEQTREAIIADMKKKVAKVQLVLSWK